MSGGNEPEDIEVLPASDSDEATVADDRPAGHAGKRRGHGLLWLIVLVILIGGGWYAWQANLIPG
ncbi:MAG: hypothetical protein HKO62_03830, partial [Gammaproteobacteria bacterium]|nr:hypothetical protein [Gammaproteobacteria bacterium]